MNLKKKALFKMLFAGGLFVSSLTLLVACSSNLETSDERQNLLNQAQASFNNLKASDLIVAKGQENNLPKDFGDVDTIAKINNLISGQIINFPEEVKITKAQISPQNDNQEVKILFTFTIGENDNTRSVRQEITISGFRSLSQDQDVLEKVAQLLLTSALAEGNDSQLSAQEAGPYANLRNYFSRTNQNPLSSEELQGATLTLATNPPQSTLNNRRTLSLVLSKNSARHLVNVVVSGFFDQVSQDLQDVIGVQSLFETNVEASKDEQKLTASATDPYQDLNDFYKRTSQAMIDERELQGVSVTIAAFPMQIISNNQRILTLNFTKNKAQRSLRVTVNGFALPMSQDEIDIQNLKKIFSSNLLVSTLDENKTAQEAGPYENLEAFYNRTNQRKPNSEELNGINIAISENNPPQNIDNNQRTLRLNFTKGDASDFLDVVVGNFQAEVSQSVLDVNSIFALFSANVQAIGADLNKSAEETSAYSSIEDFFMRTTQSNIPLNARKGVLIAISQETSQAVLNNQRTLEVVFSKDTTRRTLDIVVSGFKILPSQDELDVQAIKRLFSAQVEANDRERNFLPQEAGRFRTIRSYILRTSQAEIDFSQLKGVNISIATDPPQSFTANERTLTLLFIKNQARETLNVRVGGYASLDNSDYQDLQAVIALFSRVVNPQGSDLNASSLEIKDYLNLDDYIARTTQRQLSVQELRNVATRVIVAGKDLNSVLVSITFTKNFRISVDFQVTGFQPPKEADVRDVQALKARFSPEVRAAGIDLDRNTFSALRDNYGSYEGYYSRTSQTRIEPDRNGFINGVLVTFNGPFGASQDPVPSLRATLTFSKGSYQERLDVKISGFKAIDQQFESDLEAVRNTIRNWRLSKTTSVGNDLFKSAFNAGRYLTIEDYFARTNRSQALLDEYGVSARILSDAESPGGLAQNIFDDKINDINIEFSKGDVKRLFLDTVDNFPPIDIPQNLSDPDEISIYQVIRLFKSQPVSTSSNNNSEADKETTQEHGKYLNIEDYYQRTNQNAPSLDELKGVTVSISQDQVLDRFFISPILIFTKGNKSVSFRSAVSGFRG